MNKHQDPFLVFTTANEGRTIYIKASHIIGVSAHRAYPANEATLLLSSGLSPLNISTAHPIEERSLACRIASSIASDEDTDFT